jgi:hypothetical protein
VVRLRLGEKNSHQIYCASSGLAGDDLLKYGQLLVVLLGFSKKQTVNMAWWTKDTEGSRVGLPPIAVEYASVAWKALVN